MAYLQNSKDIAIELTKPYIHNVKNNAPNIQLHIFEVLFCKIILLIYHLLNNTLSIQLTK